MAEELAEQWAARLAARWVVWLAYKLVVLMENQKVVQWVFRWDCLKVDLWAGLSERRKVGLMAAPSAYNSAEQMEPSMVEKWAAASAVQTADQLAEQMESSMAARTVDLSDAPRVALRVGLTATPTVGNWAAMTAFG
jgi:hypothetical protein